MCPKAERLGEHGIKVPNCKLIRTLDDAAGRQRVYECERCGAEIAVNFPPASEGAVSSDPSLRLSQIRERCEKATQGPWAWESTGEKSNEWALGVVLDANNQPISGHNEAAGESDDTVVDEAIVDNGVGPFADADFIAHAREDVPYLLDLVSELIRREQALREHNEALMDALAAETQRDVPRELIDTEIKLKAIEDRVTIIANNLQPLLVYLEGEFTRRRQEQVKSGCVDDVAEAMSTWIQELKELGVKSCVQ
jgi:hypothetical protein